MINPAIVSALCKTPQAAPVDPLVTTTTTDPTEDALLRYGMDALRTGLLSGHDKGPANIPFEINISLVVDYNHGQLVLLSRRNPEAPLNRKDLAEILHSEAFSLIESWIADHQPKSTIYHIEAIAKARLSGHARVDLATRMRTYDALI